MHGKNEFHAAQTPTALQNPPLHIWNKYILHSRVRNRQFNIKINISLKMFKLNNVDQLLEKWSLVKK